MSNLNLIHRVAARYLKASYFSVGDKILWGKYKNKVGIVKSFGVDRWGNPTITIDQIPNPTGRKQPKTFGLFKIWRADVKGKVLEEQARAEKALADQALGVSGGSDSKLAEQPSELDLDDDEDDDDEEAEL